jgi:calcium-dependent protein kinase
LGAGKFGTVRLASLKCDPKVYFAIKSVELKSFKKDIKHLEEELNILQQVDHPNIIKFFESYIDQRFVHIVTELCTGGEFFDFIVANKRFDEAHSKNYMRQMLSSLQHLQGIGHRDLKPENFMLINKNIDSELKLIDFGLGKRFLQAETHMHSMVGTPYYIAPEVLKGDYTMKCDVWQLGVIFYILLSGYPPFNGDDNKTIFNGVMNKEPNFSDSVWKTVSKSCISLLKSMLTKNPEQRPSISDCLQNEWFRDAANSNQVDEGVH